MEGSIAPCLITLVVLIALVPRINAQAAGSSPSSSQYISVSVPNAPKLGEAFQVEISVVPAAKKPVTINIEPRGIKYSATQFRLKPGERKFVTATIISTHDGIEWVHAYADGYDETWAGMNSGFPAHLEFTSSSTLPYKVPTTMTLSLFDKDHKPFSASSELILHLESSDSNLIAGDKKQGPLELRMRPNATVSPQFQVIPNDLQGGPIHLSSILTLNDSDMSLDSESFSLASRPAEWLPIALAVGGGLLYGVYRVLNFTSDQRKSRASVVVIATSCLAGFIGYLIANLDLLGLKLDPNVLRSYPLLGFIVAYLGIDILLKSKVASPSTP